MEQVSRPGRVGFGAGGWPGLALGAILLTGCGAGSVALVAGANSSGGSNNPPAVGGLALEAGEGCPQARAACSPAVVAFTLTDAEGDPVDVRLCFRQPGGDFEDLELIDGVFAGEVLDTSLEGLKTASSGRTHHKLWDFAAQLGTSELREVELEASVPGTTALASFDVGNDPPAVVLDFDATDEVAGIVPIRYVVTDSSRDIVDVVVEFDAAGDGQGFSPARPAGLDAAVPTPTTTIVGLQADGPADSPEVRVFFWDTGAAGQLPELERDVVVRFTPTDRVDPGSPAEASSVHVDNNERPQLQIQGDVLVLDPDDDGTVLIPYRVSDAEEDPVEVVFQWRRPGEDYPTVDGRLLDELSVQELRAILADPLRREELHVCARAWAGVRGVVRSAEADAVVLPELGASASYVLAGGVAGLGPLELLRPSRIPAPVTPDWATNPLRAPVATLALADGLEVLVLDSESGASVLRRLELATGQVSATVPLGPGLPTTMALAPDSSSLLAALDSGGAAVLVRVDLATEPYTVEEQAFEPDTVLGPIRGLAALSRETALATSGSSLLWIDHSNPSAVRAVPVLADLASPSGVVVDPFDATRVYLAETLGTTAGVPGTGRILELEIDTRARIPLLRAPGTPLSIEEPTALAIEREGGTRLLVLGRVSATGAPGLFSIGLNEPGGRPPRLLLESDAPTNVATGPDGLRVVTASTGELLVAGGVESRRTVRAFDPAGTRMKVDVPFAPVPRVNQPWRLQREARVAPSEGTLESFPWCSAKAAAERVLLRGFAFDAEPGPPSETSGPKALARFGEPRVVTESGAALSSLALGDMDGDGRTDLVTSSLASGVQLFLQDSDGEFIEPRSVADPDGRSRQVALGDVDGDGSLDVVTAPDIVTASNPGVRIYRQGDGGGFDDPLVLPSSVDRFGPLTLGDVNGDGRTDVLAAAWTVVVDPSGDFDPTRYLVIYRQEPGGGFVETRLPGIGTSFVPFSVALEDWNRDGRVDLLVGGPNTPLILFRQELDGGFAPGEFILASSGALADVDGDGRLDCIGVASLHSLLHLREVDGSFAGPEELEVGINAFSVSPGDANGDGRIDLLFGGSASLTDSTPSLALLLQEPDGGFAPPLVLDGFPGVHNGGEVPAPLVDVDGDGLVDLVSIGAGAVIFPQERDRDFAPPRVLGGAGVTNDPWSVALGDVDGDGRLDVVSSRRFSPTALAVFHQVPGGGFAEPVGVGPPGQSALDVELVDADGDGRLDLVTAAPLAFFRQEADGDFAEPLLLDSVDSNAVAIGDVDGDGRVDLVCTESEFVNGSELRSTLRLFPQDASGGFTAASRVLDVAPTYHYELALGDVDGDGFLDLAATNHIAYRGPANRTYTLMLLRQDPSVPGSFDPPVYLGGQAVTNHPEDVALGDVDGDGRLDVVSANVGSSSVLTLFLQEAGGGFAAPVEVGGGGLAISEEAFAVALGDVDGDGRTDLVAGGYQAILIFRQRPGGSFGTPRQLPIGGLFISKSIALGDVDGNGRLDILEANRLANNVKLFLNGR